MDCDIDIFDLDDFTQSWARYIGDQLYSVCHDGDDDGYVGVFDLDGFAQVWGFEYCPCTMCSGPPWQPWPV